MLKKECERVVNRSVYYLVNCFQSFENKRKKKHAKMIRKIFHQFLLTETTDTL